MLSFFKLLDVCLDKMVEEVDKDTLEQLSQGEEFPSDGSCAGCELSGCSGRGRVGMIGGRRVCDGGRRVCDGGRRVCDGGRRVCDGGRYVMVGGM